MNVDLEMVNRCLAAVERGYEGYIPGSLKATSWWHGAEVFLVRQPGYDMLVFPGTNDWRDWTLNVQAIPWRCHGVPMHLGFYRSQRVLWKKIKPLLYPDKPLWITGHSLGGARAEITAFRLLREMKYRAPVHLVAFGKPNVFYEPEMALMLDLETQLSVVSGSDLIARVPAAKFGPDPGQDMLYLGNDERIYWNPDAAFRWNDWMWHDIISDHSTSTYRRGLRLAAAEIIDMTPEEALV